LHTAEEYLGELYDANLLKQQSPRRYHLHDLVRDCASNCCWKTAAGRGRERVGSSVGLLPPPPSAAWCARIAKKEDTVELAVRRSRRAQEAADGTAAVELSTPSSRISAR